MKTFFTAFRENTGKALCDSGDAYGRHWQKAPIDPDAPVATLDLWRNSVSATISTWHLLNQTMEIDQELQARFEAWVALDENSDLNWFEAGEKFMEELGYSQEARDNTYNQENELSQVYVYEVWVSEDWNKHDWIYNNDGMVAVIYPHNGCDARGGYASPVFCKSKTDYSVPIDLCCGFLALEARRDGEDLSDVDRQALDEHWQVGYASHPSCELERDVERVFHFTLSKDKQTVCVKLKSGEVVKIAANPPCDW